MQYSSCCSCGTITVKIDLPLSIEEYQARACDCSFCVSRELAYISDVDGTLSFSPKALMNTLKQGSGQATFWQCKNCEQVVAVTSSKGRVERGAVSAAIFERSHVLQPSVTVSPKRLSSKEKAERWQKMWLKVV